MPMPRNPEMVRMANMKMFMVSAEQMVIADKHQAKAHPQMSVSLAIIRLPVHQTDRQRKIAD